MDMSEQINKEVAEVKAALLEAMSQKKSGAKIRQAATKTPDNARSARRVPLMEASGKGGPAVSMGEMKQSWGATFKNHLMQRAIQMVDPKRRSGLITSEQLKEAVELNREFNRK